MLEQRRMLAVNTAAIAALPYSLDFSSNKGDTTYLDKDGQGTGFTYVQANKNGNQFQPSLIDLDTTAGVLKITTSGNASAGGNFNADNTLTNALGTQFNATSGGFSITTRLKGPLSYIDAPYEQGGIMFGPDQDNYVKLVVITTLDPVTKAPAQRLQFTDEQKIGSTIKHTLALDLNIGSFASINTIDLKLTGDPVNGHVFASYAINGGAYTNIGPFVAIDSTKKSAFFSTASRAGLFAMHKNSIAPVTIAFDSFSITGTTAPTLQRPSVAAVRPGSGAAGVSREVFVATDLKLPNVGHGVEKSTLSAATVRLYRTSDGMQVAARLNTSGGGDAIVLQPLELLDANTGYTFEVTSGLTDTSHASFQPYKSTFTTGTQGGTTDSTIAFEKVALPTATGKAFTTVAMGPDGRLYAGTYTGEILRWSINADGTLGAASSYSTIKGGNSNAMRSITGIAFAPGSTASSATLYVSHGAFSLETEIAAEWSGKVSRVTVTSAGVSTYQDVVTDLPRSIRDHMTNQIAFGPDGALYLSQGSNTAYGAGDDVWGMRPERLMSAAILRIDLTKIGPALSVKTEEGNNYNPFATGAPVTLFATGVRNGYDMVFARNGKLYVPGNGSAAGGNAPGYPSSRFSGTRIDGTYTGPNVPALNKIPQTESDWLYTVVKGGYYGHPNPTRGEFVLNGGNPTSGADRFEIPVYPVGTQPDRNFRGTDANLMYAMGQNYSPNGVIEYTGNAFGGKLNGKLLVARYSGGDDIAIITLNAQGGVQSVESGVAGLGRFSDPLDLVQGNNGAIYVSEMGSGRIVLVRPIAAGAKIETSDALMVFNDPRTGAVGPDRTIVIRNTGTTPLALPSDAFSIGGTDGAQWVIRARPSLPMAIAPGSSVDVVLAFNPTASTSIAIKTATLTIKSNDPTRSSLAIELRGLPTTGTGGQNEPSLQRILDLWKIKTNVGDNDASTTVYPSTPVSGSDVVNLPRLVKADTSKPVTVEVLGVMGVATNPAVRFAHYKAGSPAEQNELFTVATPDAQSVQPFVDGFTSFDPGSTEFGLYTQWPNFLDNGKQRVAYSEDVYNTWDNTNKRKARFFALRDSAGAIVANAYVVAFEEYNLGYDSNDLVAIIRNVKAPVSLSTAEIGIENLDGTPFNDRLVFNQINIKDPNIPNEPHTQVQVRINNSGAAALSISSIAFTGPFSLTAAAPTSIAAGSSVIVTVRFTATSGTYHNGTMTINSNDANESALKIDLAGHWQVQSEKNREPLLPNIVSMFGFTTQTIYSGQQLDGGGRVQAVGDEVLSPFWVRASSNAPVTVRQLAAYHSMGGRTQVAAYNKSTGASTGLGRHAVADGQSILPNADGSTTAPVYGEFSPTYAFGWKIDQENSDDTRNPQENAGGGWGHHVRFYPVKDRNGVVVPNSWLMTMDYSGINYDYQDNVYLVTNMRPETTAATPSRFAAIAFAPGTELRWKANTETNLVGYNVYRSDSPNGTYTKLNNEVSNSAKFFDTFAATAGKTYFYKLTAVNSLGRESAPAFASAVRKSAGTGTLTPPPSSAPNLYSTSANIGFTTPAGSTTVVSPNSAYNIVAGGATGIAGTSDQFRYVYRQVTGNFDVRVRVAGLTQTNTEAKAGLMAREALTGASRFVMSGANPSKTFLDSRATTGGSTARTASATGSGSNTWVRLVRSGSTFTSYASSNGTTWTTLGSINLSLNSTLYLGMAVSSKNASATTQAQFRDLASV